jgi:deferrochelatase/peroxidase EfeB
MPKPDILGRNGTYVVFRKLHQRVWAFRKYLKANSSSPEEEQLIAAKMMGRWSSGAPLALCPELMILNLEPTLNATTISFSKIRIQKDSTHHSAHTFDE